MVRSPSANEQTTCRKVVEAATTANTASNACSDISCAAVMTRRWIPVPMGGLEIRVRFFVASNNGGPPPAARSATHKAFRSAFLWLIVPSIFSVVQNRAVDRIERRHARHTRMHVKSVFGRPFRGRGISAAVYSVRGLGSATSEMISTKISSGSCEIGDLCTREIEVSGRKTLSGNKVAHFGLMPGLSRRRQFCFEFLSMLVGISNYRVESPGSCGRYHSALVVRSGDEFETLLQHCFGFRVPACGLEHTSCSNVTLPRGKGKQSRDQVSLA